MPKGHVDIDTDGNVMITFVSDYYYTPPATTHEYEIKVFSESDLVVTGDGAFIFAVPSDMNNFYLIDAQAYVSTISSSGTPTIQIRNSTTAHDILSTKITIDASEFTSYTAATSSAINSTYRQVSTGNLIAIDIDVAGTGARGLGVILKFSA